MGKQKCLEGQARLRREFHNLCAFSEKASSVDHSVPLTVCVVPLIPPKWLHCPAKNPWSAGIPDKGSPFLPVSSSFLFLDVGTAHTPFSSLGCRLTRAWWTGGGTEPGSAGCKSLGMCLAWPREGGELTEHASCQEGFLPVLIYAKTARWAAHKTISGGSPLNTAPGIPVEFLACRLPL